MKIAIIGGGAAGMMAAISAAKCGGDVTIFESTDRIGNKILLTGNGKCNFSNLYLEEETCYYSKNADFLKKIFQKCPPERIYGFFEQEGMLVKNKKGYLYPMAEQASVVLDILRLALKRLNVKLLTEEKVIKITKEDETFCITTEKEHTAIFDKVIITTGGRSYPKTGSDGSGYKLAKKLGHSIIPTVPALVQLVGKDDFYKEISGVRSEGVVKLFIDKENVCTHRGEIQFTDYGISGIPIFQLSRMAAYGIFFGKSVTVAADVLPELDAESIKSLVEMRKILHKDNTADDFMCGITNKKLCRLAIKQQRVKPGEKIRNIPDDKLYEMILYLKNISFAIVNTKGYDTAQVTAGGVDISELNENLQSQFVKNLFFAGEIIDVDGICGGYNLQWAFATGYVAGMTAAKEKVEKTVYDKNITIKT